MTAALRSSAKAVTDVPVWATPGDVARRRLRKLAFSRSARGGTAVAVAAFMLRVTASAILFSSVFLATACADDDQTIDRDGFESTLSCGEPSNASIEALRGSLGAEWTGVVFRNIAGAPSVTAESGTRCTDTRCSNALAAEISAAPGVLPQGDGGGSLVVVKNGEVRAVHRADDLAPVLSAIDSEAKMHLVMWAHGYDVECERSLKRTAAGFEGIGRIFTSTCPLRIEEHRVSVDRDATLVVLERREVKRDDSSCP